MNDYESVTQEWYSEEVYDSSPTFKVINNPFIALAEKISAFGKAIQKSQKTQQDFVLTSSFAKAVKPLAHSMAPPPGARLYDHRGRKRY